MERKTLRQFSTYLFTVLAACCLIDTKSADARPMTLGVGELFAFESTTCGLIRNKWKSGKMNKRGKFVPWSDQIKKLKNKSRKQSGKRRTKTLKKLRNLRKRSKVENDECQEQSLTVSAVPTASPTLPPTPEPVQAPPAPTTVPTPTIDEISWTLSPRNLGIHNQLGQAFTYFCPANGSIDLENFFGTNTYSASYASICTAAAHMGIITVANGGNVSIKIDNPPLFDGFSFYGYRRNGIESRSWEGSSNIFYFLDNNGSRISVEPLENPISWGLSPRNLGVHNQLGQIFTYYCPANGVIDLENFFGTDSYSASYASICTAAAHMGVITVANGGNVSIKIDGIRDDFSGSERNGIESRSWGGSSNSFSFVD